MEGKVEYLDQIIPWKFAYKNGRVIYSYGLNIVFVYSQNEGPMIAIAAFKRKK